MPGRYDEICCDLSRWALKGVRMRRIAPDFSRGDSGVSIFALKKISLRVRRESKACFTIQSIQKKSAQRPNRGRGAFCFENPDSIVLADQDNLAPGDRQVVDANSDRVFERLA